jgi:CpeT protein
MNIIKFFIVGYSLLLMGCYQQQRPASQDLEKLVLMMSGQFDSSKQAMKDDSYYNISLKMIPIWQNSETTGKWLYVEQAVSKKQDKPYRQRMYHVLPSINDTFISQVYELPDPAAVIGAYENIELLSNLNPNDLKLREGCAVILKKVNDQEFAGSTRGKECLSSLRGAQYATSEVVVTPISISSWDQGFDANNQQVWGATAGPYVFNRIE